MIDSDGVIGPFVRTSWNYDTNQASIDTGLACADESLTQQQFRDECDINNILRNFGVTGHLPTTAVQPMAGDFTEIGDYQEALEAVRASEENFLALPSSVRDRFQHDPRVFVDFCLNPANLEAVRELGLAPRPPAPTIAELKPSTPA